MFFMDRTEERWRQLCAQAAVEQDPRKLMELVREITRLLAEKYDRAKDEEIPHTPDDPSPSS